MAKSKRAVQEAAIYANSTSDRPATVIRAIILSAETRLADMKRIGVSKVRLEPMTWSQCEILIRALRTLIAYTEG